MSNNEKRILLVDDFSTLRRIAMNHLKALGYRYIEEASDGGQALIKLRSTPIDALLCCINLPVIDGPALIAEMRADPCLADIPALLLCHEMGEREQTIARQAGADGLLLYPLNTNTLKTELERVFGKTGAVEG